ncbi:MAG: hypothetical protein WDZ94_02280 [Patescibacteria group bacterium]
MKDLINLGIFLIIAWFAIRWIGGFGKYEGLTAEEWADEYYAENSARVGLANCVESESNYYYGDDFDDLRDRLDNVQSCL